MAIRNIQVAQDFIKKMQQRGSNSSDIVQSLTKERSAWDERLPSRVQQLKQSGIGDTRILRDLLSIKSDTQLVGEDDMKTRGILGGVSQFLGVEPIARGLGTALARKDPQFQRNLQTLEEQGQAGSADVLRRGGLNSGQVVGSAASTALNLPAAGLGGFLRGASKLKKGGALVGGGAAAGAAGGLQETGTAEGTIKGAQIGAIAAPALVGGLKGAQAMSRILFKSLPNKAASVITGKPIEVIETLAERPNEALKGIDNPTGALKEATDNIRNKMFNRETGLMTRMSQAYKNQFDEIVDSMPAGFKLNVNKQRMTDDFMDSLDEFGIKVGDEGLDFSRATKISPSEERNITKALTLISEADDFSIKGMDTLRKQLDDLINFESPSAQGSKASALLKRARNTVNSYITDEVPDVGILNQTYSERVDFLNAIKKELGLNKRGLQGQQKTFKKLANLFGKNKDLTRELVIDFEKETGIDVLGTVAGREFSSEVGTRFQQGDLLRSVLTAVISPKTVGKLTVKGAQVRNLMSDLIPKLNPEAKQQLNSLVGFDVVKELAGSSADQSTDE